MKKLASVATALVMGSVLFASAPVFADSPGQLSNGATNYKVRNVTTDGNTAHYAQNVAAACGDTVKYSITLANSDFGTLSDLTVKANLKSGAISASAKNISGDITTVSGSATVTTTGTLEYVAGSTVRINAEDTSKSAKQPDGITADGVNVGDLNGSTDIFVQFEAKVKCETPAPNQIKVCDLNTKKVVTINESDFDAKKYSKDLTECNATVTPPTTLVNTGAGNVAALFVGVAAVATAAYSFVTRRQNAR